MVVDNLPEHLKQQESCRAQALYNKIPGPTGSVNKPQADNNKQKLVNWLDVVPEFTIELFFSA